MPTFIMFGKYSHESIKEISAERTQKASQLVSDNGGTVKSGYALLGDTDLVVIADFPNNQAAMKTSVGLARLLGISFSTAPAVSMDEFDKLVG
ncbi:MAG: GYD domain-containing protein [Chloroflexota bacterium]|nr:MAG: GYD domain-containing protein [Chloroflexota bacterium]